MASETNKPGWWGRGILALGSALVTALLCWAFLVEVEQAPATDSVVVVDNLDAMDAMIEERSREALPEQGAQGASGDPGVWPPPLERVIFDEESAQRWFPQLKSSVHVFEPLPYFWHRPSMHYQARNPEHPRKTWRLEYNALGLRMPREVMEEAPELRVIVTGDSHTAGVVPPQEVLSRRLEIGLREARRRKGVEVLNAGVGGFHLYNYLGTLEHLADLQPDVFVVVVYGGNDFSGCMPLQRYFTRRGLGSRVSEEVRAILTGAKENWMAPMAQELAQASYFQRNPDDVQVAIDTAASLTAEMRRLCEESETLLVMAYLPPPSLVQPQHYTELLGAPMEALGLAPEDLDRAARIADGWLEWMRSEGIPSVDLRDVLAAQEEPCYWFRDLHLNTLGHDLAAAEIQHVLEPLLEARGH